ncbi:hypothetical protein ACA910_011290 [Epithemia clementina (nom. ined.)]
MAAATFDYSAVGFLVLDTLCHPAEEMPPPGGAIFVNKLRMTPSGTAGGTAMICALLGLTGQLVTEVGMDDAGDFLVNKLQQYGVSTSLISRNKDGVQTSCSMLPIPSSGDRVAFFCPGTSATFQIPPDKYEAVLDAKIIHLGGTGLLAKFDGPPSLELVRRAKELGRTTVFDLIFATAETVPLVQPLLPYLDFFVPSIVEAASLAGVEGSRDASAISQIFKDRGVKNVVLTMDKDGVFVNPEHGEPFSIPAHDIKVVDTTGCGDSFTAGVIVGISKGWDLNKTARFANAVAAQVASGLGSDGNGSIVSIEKTLAFMDSTPLTNRSDS